MTVKKELIDILRCPACVAGKEGLALEVGMLYVEEEDMLVCRSCGRKYPVKDGIPDMTLDQNVAGR